MTADRILVFGFGNPARQDDGLGPAAAEAVGHAGIPNVTAVSGFQLGPEDAELAFAHEEVYFLDAAREGEEPFVLRSIEPGAAITFTSHALAPESVLALCETVFGRAPRAWSAAIRGYTFDIGEEISPKARRNLEAAVEHILSRIRLRKESTNGTGRCSEKNHPDHR